MDLNGRVVIVTGASRGFGLLIARGLVEAGARVTATARGMTEDLAALAERAGRSSVLALKADAADPAACETVVAATVEAFGRVDALINNAAMGMNALARDGRRPDRFWELSPADFERAMAVNAVGPFLMSRLVVPGMVERGAGRIVNLTTSPATMQRPGYTPYGPSKAALEAATVAWAGELTGTGVTVNVLIPGGPARTRMITEDPAIDIPDAVLVAPEAMVAPALWLVGGEAGGFTGRRLIASRWRDDLPSADAAEAASEPAGWHAP